MFSPTIILDNISYESMIVPQYDIKFDDFDQSHRLNRHKPDKMQNFSLNQAVIGHR